MKTVSTRKKLLVRDKKTKEDPKEYQIDTARCSVGFHVAGVNINSGFAIALFQRDNGLPIDANDLSKVRSKLQEIHGC